MTTHFVPRSGDTRSEAGTDGGVYTAPLPDAGDTDEYAGLFGLNTREGVNKLGHVRF